VLGSRRVERRVGVDTETALSMADDVGKDREDGPVRESTGGLAIVLTAPEAIDGVVDNGFSRDTDLGADFLPLDEAATLRATVFNTGVLLTFVWDADLERDVEELGGSDAEG
jgi:hypothetical protein